jgi:hypothetical protein
MSNLKDKTDAFMSIPLAGTSVRFTVAQRLFRLLRFFGFAKVIFIYLVAHSSSVSINKGFSSLKLSFFTYMLFENSQSTFSATLFS